MLRIVSLHEEHLDAAAELVSKRYRQLLEQEPHLPSKYEDASMFLPLLQEILSRGGVAALSGGRLVGFLTGWKMPSFRGKRSVYSPEWANGAELEDSARIYEALYGRLAADWVAEKYSAHYISLFPNDIEALRTWHWLGFGMVSVDALRGLESLEGFDADVDIRQAGLQDLEQVLDLQEDLYQYHTEAPIFLLGEKSERSYYEEWLQNPNKVVWLAYWKEEPVALMRLGPADEDVATIILDKKTTSIYAAFTKEKVRREGIATALLAHAIQSAKKAGYERCAVSFEPMNALGKRFWLKTFNPVCLSMVRHIDDRFTNISSE